MKNGIKLITIDSFCGAGGTTKGFHDAKFDGEACVSVIIGINHDAKAIASHASNHPETYHFVEDFRTLDPRKLIAIIERAKQNCPGAKVLFWMSAECTNHSKAKGGCSRDADSRSLPEYAYKYIEILNPDIIGVENVVEFLDWGPLMIKVVKDKQGNELYCPIEIKKDKKTKKVIGVQPKCVPIPEHKGEYYNVWVEKIQSYGYHYGFDKLNAADYGAYTSRIRYFGFFSKDSKHIVFPEKTHSKDGKNDLKKHMAVREVLELDREGESIFDRKKELCENTKDRVLSGLIKYVAGGKDKWLLKYNSVNGKTGKHIPPSVDEPCPVISCQNRLGVVSTQFLSKYFSGKPDGKNISIEQPCGSVTTVDHHSLVSASFISVYYGNGYTQSIEKPAPTLTTKDRLALVKGEFFVNHYSGGGQTSCVTAPCPALTAIPKQNLVTYGRWLMNTNYHNVGSGLDVPAPVITANRKHHYLVNPQYSSSGGSVEVPCFTLIARMDKRPPSLVTAKTDCVKLPSFIKISGNTVIYEIYETDSPKTKQIKEFMALYGLTDVKMRMLLELELLRIMGFGDDYVLQGTQTDKKRFIGNAVECKQSKALAEAIAATV